MTHSRTETAGLALCALLGVVDIISVAGLGADEGPPPAVIILGVVLGIITLVGIRLAWKDRRGGVAAVVVSRVLSALTGVPAFFAEDAPDWAPVAVGIGIALTVAALGLLLIGRNRESATPAMRSNPADVTAA